MVEPNPVQEKSLWFIDVYRVPVINFHLQNAEKNFGHLCKVFFTLHKIFTCNSFMLNVTQCSTQKLQATKHRLYFSPIEQGTATHEHLMAVTVLFSSRLGQNEVLFW